MKQVKQVMHWINNHRYRHPDERTSTDHTVGTMGIKRGPLAFLSLGTFLLVVGLVILLPGQDIAAGRPHSPYQEQQEQVAAQSSEFAPLPPRLADKTCVVILPARRPRYYHWRSDCPLLYHRDGTPRRPGATLLYDQVRHQHLGPCSYCLDLAVGNKRVLSNP